MKLPYSYVYHGECITNGLALTRNVLFATLMFSGIILTNLLQNLMTRIHVPETRLVMTLTKQDGLPKCSLLYTNVVICACAAVIKTYIIMYLFMVISLRLLYVNITPESNKAIHIVSSAYKATFTWNNMRTLQSYQLAEDLGRAFSERAILKTLLKAESAFTSCFIIEGCLRTVNTLIFCVSPWQKCQRGCVC
ncbi:unnamed protein product [Trifolium pratense]|uniref:Uncharacterized protein n=1 Tax=Trifolium pratense TaxID=57577 RepID=A0ACB0LKL3_TRIPR|nr:unnamed protein product [Trifolium pratense]